MRALLFSMVLLLGLCTGSLWSETTVTDVSTNAPDGPYTVGNILTITVTFSGNVTVTGMPTIQLNSQTSDVCTYQTGSGTSVLSFVYMVVSPDSCVRLDASSMNALNLNGGTIDDPMASAVNLTLPVGATPGSLASAHDILIETGNAPAFITSVTSPTDGTYGVNSTVDIYVTFNEPVFLIAGTGQPTLSLNTGGVAIYSSGSGTSILKFSYTPVSPEATSDLDVMSVTSASTNPPIPQVACGDSTYSTGPTAADLSLIDVTPLSVLSNIVIDTTTPTISSVSSSVLNGSYGVGALIPIVVTFSKPVEVVGSPTLILVLNSVNTLVTYTPVPPGFSKTQTFNYTVSAGQNTSRLDYLSATRASPQQPFSLNGGTIRDIATNDADMTSAPTAGTPGSLSNPGDIVIDTISPTVSVVTSSITNQLISSGVVPILISFTESGTAVPLTVTGSPTLKLNTGTSNDFAIYNQAATQAYTTLNGPGTLVFNYTVMSGDDATALNYTTFQDLSLNSGTIQDAAGNAAILSLPVPSQSALLGADITIDTAPVVVDLDSTTSSTTPYDIGGIININVHFSKAVTFTGSPPILLLNAGTAGSPALATYVTGSGTNILDFTYTVRAGDAANPLDCASTTALMLPSGTTLVDALSVAANPTLPLPGSAMSLSGAIHLIVDGIAPTISTLSSTPSSTFYHAGQTVSISVGFSEPVTVTGVPQLPLALTLNSTPVSALYASGTGGSTLIFQFVVATGENASDLDISGTSLVFPSGAAITDLAGNPLVATLPAAGTNSSLAASHIGIDTLIPAVASVSAEESSGTYASGTIHVVVAFAEGGSPVPLVVTGSPTLLLNTGNSNNDLATYNAADTATYLTAHPVTGLGTLVFDYTIANVDAADPLNYATTLALTLSGGTIQDAAGNAATLVLPSTSDPALSLGASGIIVDTLPVVVKIDSTTSHTTPYGVNDSIHIDVHFSKPVVVVGTPTLKLNAGTPGNTALATYFTGSGTNTLDFTYVVRSGDMADPLDCASTSALVTPVGASISDGLGLAANLTLPAPASATSLSGAILIPVDGMVPTITSIASMPSPMSYRAGQLVSITVTFSEAVIVIGVPQLPLNVTSGGAQVSALYASGSGSSALTFQFTVAAGETATALDASGTNLVFPGGAVIADAAGNQSLGVLPATATSNSLAVTSHISIDTTAPTVVSITAPAATYGAGQTIPITVTFSEPVTVTTTLGTPSLALNLGNAATYLSGSGTAALVFSYVVLATDPSEAPLNYASTSALATNGGVLADAAGNTAILTLPATSSASALGASNAIVYTTSPYVVSVTSSTPNAVYTLTDTITLIVTFNVPVVVSAGTPSLALNTAPSQGIATYASGSGSATLSFTYVVIADQATSHLDVSGASALLLNGATIADQHANPASLIVPFGAAAGSLASTTSIAILTAATPTPPSVVSLTSPTPNGPYDTGAVIEIDVNYSSPVTVTGTPSLMLNAQGTGIEAQAFYSSGSGSTLLKFLYTVQTGNSAVRLDAASSTAMSLGSGVAIADPYSTAVNTLPQPGAANSLSATSDLQINPGVPNGKPGTDTVGITPASSGGCGLGGGAALLGLTLCLTGRRRAARSRVRAWRGLPT